MYYFTDSFDYFRIKWGPLQRNGNRGGSGEVKEFLNEYENLAYEVFKKEHEKEYNKFDENVEEDDLVVLRQAVSALKART